jgi:uncharacterized protein
VDERLIEEFEMTDRSNTWLQERGFAVDSLESRAFNGNTPLLQAALEGDIKMVKLFVDAGADLYAVNNDYNGVLFNACYADSAAIIRILVAAGADLDDINEEGETALMYAVSASKLRSVKTLLSLGADESMQNVDGYSAIDYAVNRTIFQQLRHA